MNKLRYMEAFTWVACAYDFYSLFLKVSLTWLVC